DRLRLVEDACHAVCRRQKGRRARPRIRLLDEAQTENSRADKSGGKTESKSYVLHLEAKMDNQQQHSNGEDNNSNNATHKGESFLCKLEAVSYQQSAISLKTIRA